MLGVVVLAAIFLVMSMKSLVDENTDGEYQIKQSWPAGEMSVRSDAGMYGQYFGSIYTYRNVATVGFGRDEDGDGIADLPAIPVIFNDGSKALITGLIRLRLPDDPNQRLT